MSAILSVNPIQVGFIITPSIIFLTLWIDFEKINGNLDQGYNQKFGSLFQEFRCNESLLCFSYYSIFTLWNLLYSINQLYTTKSEYVQRGLNLVLSIFMMMYLVIFRPFKQKSILLSNIVCWIFNCVLFLIIFSRSFLEFFNQDDNFDFFFIGTVIIQILFQYTLNLILCYLKIKKFYLKHYSGNESVEKNIEQRSLD